MKKILLAMSVVAIMSATGRAEDYYITRGTVTIDAINVTSSAAVLVSLSPALGLGKGNNFYSVSLYNVGSSSAVYTLCASATACSPALTCANGIPIPTGTMSAPGSITEQFEGLYMWALSCGNSAISDMRRIIRGR